MARQLFEPLLRFDENLVPQPAAAKSYEVSIDGTVYTFHLRPDGRWSDGQPVVAADFAFSWKRLMDPSQHAEYAALFTQAGVVSVNALDDLTFQVQLSQPFGGLPSLAALWVSAPLRPDLVRDGWDSDPTTLVGNGPFMLSEWVHQDHLVLVPNPYYTAHLGWPTPTLTRVTVRMDDSPEAEYAAYQRSQRPDWVLVPDAEVNQALNDPNLANQTRTYTELTTFWIQFNTARAPLDNVLVRRALAKAIDRAALVRDLTAGVSQPATSIVPPGMPGFQAGLGHELDSDAGGARNLLGGASLSLRYVYPDSAANMRRAQYLQSVWSDRLGINVELSPMDDAEYEQALDNGAYDLAFGGWSADYPDPRDWFSPLFGCNAEFNKFAYCSVAFDQLVARADASADSADRLQLYAQAQTMLMQDVPVAPLFVRGRLVLAEPWVQALTVTPLDEYPGSLFLDKVQILPH